MSSVLNQKLTLPIVLALTFLTACNGNTKPPADTSVNKSIQEGQNSFKNSSTELTVYKSPTCGCCKHWITHLEQENFTTETKHPDSLTAIKDQLKIPTNKRSCHTAVSQQGFVFEGHVPARYIQEFLANPPKDAIGLSVPAMPIGSPGMEVGDKFMPYSVFVLKDNASDEVFARVETAEQQFE